MVDQPDLPGDGRPCNTDVFLAALVEDDEIDAYEFVEAVEHWVHGGWDDALEYLDDAVAEKLRKEGKTS